MSSALQNKLSNYEVKPPAKSWESIAAALDQDGTPLQQKLYAFEVTPGADIWNRVAEKLDAGSEAAPVVPFSKRYRTPLRYSGVAAAILVVGIITSLLLTKKAVSDGLVENNITHHLPDTGNQLKDVTAAPADTQSPPRIDNDKPLATRTSTAKANIERPVSFAYMSSERQSQPSAIRDITEDKYMLFIDGDGNAMRLSKKLFKAFACAAYDYACKERISSLQAKVASTAVTADFTGILDMLRNLQENQ